MIAKQMAYIASNLTEISELEGEISAAQEAVAEDRQRLLEAEAVGSGDVGGLSRAHEESQRNLERLQHELDVAGVRTKMLEDGLRDLREEKRLSRVAEIHAEHQRVTERLNASCETLAALEAEVKADFWRLDALQAEGKEIGAELPPPAFNAAAALAAYLRKHPTAWGSEIERALHLRERNHADTGS